MDMKRQIWELYTKAQILKLDLYFIHIIYIMLYFIYWILYITNID